MFHKASKETEQDGGNDESNSSMVSNRSTKGEDEFRYGIGFKPLKSKQKIVFKKWFWLSFMYQNTYIIFSISKTGLRKNWF